MFVRFGNQAAIIVALLLLMTGPIQFAAAQQSSIRAVVDEYSRLLEEGDVNQLLELFVDDPVFVHPMLPVLVGRDALRTFVEQIIGQQAASGNAIRVERITMSDDDWAYVVAQFSTTWVPNNGAEPFEEEDRYLFVVRRHSTGEWKIKWCAFYPTTGA